MLDFIYKLPLGVIGIIVAVSGFIWAEAEIWFCERFKSIRKWKIFNLCFALLALLAVLYTTFLTRSAASSVIRMIPFHSFEMAKSNPEMYRTMMMNVFLFLPFGLFVGSLMPKKLPAVLEIVLTFLLGIAFSVGIEYVQYKYSLGICEIDDIICNSFGVLMGSLVIFWKRFLVWFRKQSFYNIRLSKYLAITFSITWICWSLLAIIQSPEYHFGFRGYLSTPLHIIGGFAPFFAVLAVCDEKVSFKYLLNIFKRYNSGTTKYLLAFMFLEIAVFGLSSMERNAAIPIFAIPIIFVEAVLIYGGNEEIGWRGLMQPLLEKRFPYPIATLITGVVWSAWHIPLWFVYGSSQQNMSFLLFTLLGIILSFWFSAIYKKTQSVFFCAILHGLTNTLLSVFIIKINIALIVGLIVLTAYSLYLYYKNADCL